MIESPFLVVETIEHLDRAINTLSPSARHNRRAELVLVHLKVARLILQSHR